MSGALLVINSGSSSLKFGLYAARGEALHFKGSAVHIGSAHGKLTIRDGAGQQVFTEEVSHPSQEVAFREAVSRLERFHPEAPVAIGHRLVHGGPHLRQHQALTPEVLQALEDATHFAPLHIPPALELIHAVRKRYPGVPQFACFDTAFHATLPEEASAYALPRAYREQGVQRYGFHGLSYESIVEQLRPEVPARTVVAHLGSGASFAALEHGTSVDTSMGLTPTGGIPMATRTGDLDPGVLLWLLRSARLDVDALESLVNHDAGLKGLSGGSPDMQALTEAAASGDTAAALAISVFTRSVAKTVGAYAAVLGGLDLLVFTGGVGENSHEVRQQVCARLGHLGIALDDARPPPAGSRCAVRVLPSDEEGRIAHHVRRLLHL
ncbi:acetate/propionate family kinase [Stigmatella hybrida]|uniref:acetate/propionate family kinase n=1 Tax=Stigmatella hybrida TaxID=394097 RepID=UPI001CDADFD9|nr:acetate/propionate family kinase [Stigmatella hybrida]